MRRYSDSHPYEIVRVIGKTDEDRDVWQYNLEVTTVPGPMLSGIVGDCIHCVRCALDHFVSGHLAPGRKRERSSFPVRTKDPWEKLPNGRYVFDQKARSGFNNALAGLPKDAIAAIKELQPYWSSNPGLDPLTIISDLDNSDKHRQIATMLFGIEGVSTQVFVRGRDATEELRANRSILETGNVIEEGGLVQTGTPVARFVLLDPTITEAEVEVKVSGAAKVAIRVEDPVRNLIVPDTLRTAIDFVGDDVLLRLLKAIQDETTP